MIVIIFISHVIAKVSLPRDKKKKNPTIKEIQGNKTDRSSDKLLLLFFDSDAPVWRQCWKREKKEGGGRMDWEAELGRGLEVGEKIFKNESVSVIKVTA